jgi:hypothetical protein
MRTFVRLASVFLAVLVNLSLLATAQAQAPNDYSDGPGRSINGDIRAAVQSQWEQLSPAEITCIDRGLRRRGGSINTVIGQGIGPSDSRVARFRRDCQSAAQNPGAAQERAGAARTGPSFDCRRASSDDEIAICGDAELSRLDRAIGDGFNYLRSRLGSRAARRVTDPMLRQRGDCENDVACIKRIQQMTISLLQSRGAPIQAEEAAPPSNAPGAVDRPGAPPSPVPQPAPATPVEPQPQAAQPLAPPKPAAAPAPPVVQAPAPAPPAVAPVKPADAPANAASIRDVAPGITAPAIVASPASVTAPTKTETGSLVYLLIAIIVVLCGVVGLLLLRLTGARGPATPETAAAPATAVAPAVETVPAKADAPASKPAEDAIIPLVTAMPSAPASQTKPEPAMDLASLAPTDKPLDEPARAEPQAPAAPAAAPETPAAAVSAEKPVASR